MPAGSQQARRSTSTRWRGGKPPGAARAGRIINHFYAPLLEAAAQSPDGGPVQFESVSQLRDDGVRLVHRQQDACSTRNALLDTSVSYQGLKVGDLCW
jgi:hypothetical protein